MKREEDGGRRREEKRREGEMEEDIQAIWIRRYGRDERFRRGGRWLR